MKNLRQVLSNANALIVFESAGRLMSFTRAAEELGISQPAVTRHIKAIESVLERPLFHRNHNRLTLSADGLRLWSSVAAGFGEVAGTIETMRREKERARLVLATHSGFAQQWLMPRLSDLGALLPDYDVRLLIADSDSDLDRGDADFSVRMGKGNWPDQGSHMLIGECVYPVASPAFLDRFPELRDASPKELLGAPLLHMDEGDKPWMTWRAWFAAQGVREVPPRPDVIYNNYPLVLQQALAGKGVALAWRPLVDHHTAQRSLLPIGAEIYTLKRGYYLTWPLREPSLSLNHSICGWFAKECQSASRSVQG
ncbi:MAG: LysR substrate-binding domain-containing protein [Rhodovibrionaceae bacterium]|nr:LysR substrate-binding domain-containing protein [Rhodovibrionaceae bacterium]